MRAWPTSTSTRAPPAAGVVRGSLVVSELETTVRRLVAPLETSVAAGAVDAALEGMEEETVALAAAVVAAAVVAVASAATSTTMTAMEEIIATLVVWIGGATSRRRIRLQCQPKGNHMLT